jgi:hypothetical protein
MMTFQVFLSRLLFLTVPALFLYTARGTRQCSAASFWIAVMAYVAGVWQMLPVMLHEDRDGLVKLSDVMGAVSSMLLTVFFLGMSVLVCQSSTPV